jgi:hypothetical protein
VPRLLTLCPAEEVPHAVIDVGVNGPVGQHTSWLKYADQPFSSLFNRLHQAMSLCRVPAAR